MNEWKDEVARGKCNLNKMEGERRAGSGTAVVSIQTVRWRGRLYGPPKAPACHPPLAHITVKAEGGEGGEGKGEEETFCLAGTSIDHKWVPLPTTLHLPPSL